MKITSFELREIIDSSIIEYNQNFFGKELEEKALPLIEDDEEISEETLSKIENLRITIIPQRLSEEEINTFNSELKSILEKMNLKVFTINVLSKNPTTTKYNLEFLNSLNSNIENLQLRGIDLSDKGTELFDKFNNLRILSLDKCNISNPEIISNINENVSVSIKSNKIDPNYYKKAIDLLEKHHGKLETSDKELQAISDAFRWKKIDIQTFLNTRNIVDYKNIQGLYISIDDSFKPNEEELNEAIDVLNSMQNAKLKAPIGDFLRISKQKSLTISTKIIIKSANELQTKTIEENSNIESIAIEDGENSIREQAEPYTREDFLQVRKRIDEIISDIKIPEQSDSSREKKIFAQVYKKLAEQIVYDEYAITEEGAKDKKLEVTCRNLYGGLIQGKSVCAGYADILRNVLACVDIDAKFIGELPNTEAGSTFKLNDARSCMEYGFIRWKKLFNRFDLG